MADRRRAPAMRGSRFLCLAVVCLGSALYMPARCQNNAGADRTLPELPQVGNLPHLPAVNVASFAGSEVQPVLEALPAVAPSPSIKEVGYEAAHAAVLQAQAASRAARNAVTPAVSEARAVEGPVQAIAYAVNAVASDFASGLGPSGAMPPVPGPRPANIIITGEDDTSVEAEAAAPSTGEGPPELPQLPQPAPLPQAPQQSAPAPAPASSITSLTSRPNDALHSAGVTSFTAVQQQPQQPAQPTTELIQHKDGTETVIVKMPRVADPSTSLQSLPGAAGLPHLPGSPQSRRMLQEGAPAPAPMAEAPVRGLPSLPAVPALGLPDMPEIALPATAEGLVTPLPAPRPQGPAAAAAYEAARPYSAFYKLLPVLSGTGVGRKLSQQGGPQQQPGPQQQGPQQPAAGQAQPQSFQEQPQSSTQSKPAVQSAPLTIHPDIYLDQTTKILTLGQGDASIFGQKYTLPALPFKLPATPALNSLQSLYPNMNLGDAPLVEGPALAPGYAPAPQAEINAAVAAEEAPTPEEKAVTNPLTNVISALLTGRRLQQQPGPQQQQPAAGQAQPQSFQEQPQTSPQAKPAAQSAPLTIHPDIYLDQTTKILTLGQGDASIFGQKYTLPALPFKLPATPALNSLQSLYPNMNLGDAPLVEGPALAPGYAPAPQAEISAAIAAEEAPTPEEKAVTNPLTNVISALLTGRRLQETDFEQLNSQPLSVKDAAGVANSAISESLQEAQQIFNPPAMAPAASAPSPSQGGARGLPALPSVPDLGLRGMPAIALPQNPSELWAPLPAPNENNIFATRTAEAVRPYTTFYKALPHVPGSAVQGRKLTQLPANDPNKPAQPFGYRNPKPLIQFQPKVLVDQKNRKAFATGGDVLLANGEKIPLPGGFALPTTGLWSGLLDIPQGAVVDGPVPAPDLAPAKPGTSAPAMAPAPSAAPNNPLSFLVNALTSIGDAAEADANKSPTASGRRLTQLPGANDPNKPAQPFGYRNPKPLIQVEPKMLIDQKNRKAYATGGDILLANGQKIPLPGGFALPTTGLWSNLLDIPAGTQVEGPIPAPDLAPAMPAHHAPSMAPAMAPAPSAASAGVNPLSFLVQGITSIGDALEAQANAKQGTRRRLSEGQEAVEGLTLSLALLGESRETFGPKQEAFAKELEQALGLQAGAVQVERMQLQQARYAEDVLRIARHLLADVRAREQADLVVTFTVDTATPEETLAALKGMVSSSGQLTSALQSIAGVHLAPESLRKVPPASEA